MSTQHKRPNAAAYGGPGWLPRRQSLREEIGRLWGLCGSDSEWAPLKAVLLHPPGDELKSIQDPDEVQFLEIPDLPTALAQHQALAAAYQAEGVQVHFVNPGERSFPNLMFLADLLFMTPQGAILARPASEVRAGEERWVARRLAELGIPILHTVHGRGTFEGADALWIRPNVVLLATGLRTNPMGAEQVSSVLHGMGVEVLRVSLPADAMHLMGSLRLVSPSAAVAWHARLPEGVEQRLALLGIQTHYLPDAREASAGHALNFVTLAENRILAPAGNPQSLAFYKSLGVTCLTVEVGELAKAAGAIGCMTGVLERELVPAEG